MEWLAAVTASVAKFCDAIVAVDGAYMLFPDALQHPASPPEQARTILETASAAGIAASVSIPSEPWWGNEVEKRSAMFRLAEAQSAPWDDWYFVIDADEVVTHVPADVHEVLARTEHHVAAGVLYQRPMSHPAPAGDEGPTLSPRELVEPTHFHRCLFRAIPGLRVEHAHSINACEIDGKTVYLRGRDDLMTLEPFEDVRGLRIEHRHDYRPWARSRAAHTYMQNRDAALAESVIVTKGESWLTSSLSPKSGRTSNTATATRIGTR